MPETPFAHFIYRLQQRWNSFSPNLVLAIYSIIALFPIYMITINSFKARKAIFGMPFQLPNKETFSLIGYETVLSRANFLQYFTNTLL
jgi:raffinose/stachyose/melibiose transport system permease protein